MSRRTYTRSMHALLVALAGAAFLIPAITHDVGELWPSDAARDWQRPEQPANVPTWAEYADEFPEGCRAKRTDDELADLLAVVDVHADALVMTFDEAWTRNTDDDRIEVVFGYQPAGPNDVYVVGICR